MLSQGWSRFYFQGADFGKDPYINGWNYPGLTPAAVDKIIEIEDAKGVRINGIMSDVIGVETGQNSRGEDEAWTNSWYAHVNGLQRGLEVDRERQQPRPARDGEARKLHARRRRPQACARHRRTGADIGVLREMMKGPCRAQGHGAGMVEPAAPD